MKTFTLPFRVIGPMGHVWNIELTIAHHGDYEGLFLEGEDYSQNGEVLQAFTNMIGSSYIQSVVSGMALNMTADEMREAKNRKELLLEQARKMVSA